MTLQANPSVTQDPLDFVEEVVDQGLRVLEMIGASWILLGAMPVIGRLAAVFKPRALGRHIVRVVEADQSSPVRPVKRKRIGQAMRPVLGCLDARNFDLSQ
jgi:hypothetical protein